MISIIENRKTVEKVEFLEFTWTEEDCETWIALHGLGLRMWIEFWNSWDEKWNKLEFPEKALEIIESNAQLLEKVWRFRLVDIYGKRFFNRQDTYATQWISSDGRCNYAFQKDGDKNFEPDLRKRISSHLKGVTTLSLPAVSLEGTCKWACWDSDDNSGRLYEVEKALLNLGMHPFREAVRRGRDGHLWVFFDQPVMAEDLIVFNTELFAQLQIDPKEIEFFPKSADRLSQLRAPLGIHRKPGADNARGWFEDAVKGLDCQMVFVAELETSSATVVENIATVVKHRAPAQIEHRKEFEGEITDIRDVVVNLRRCGKESSAACPACRLEGKDTHGDNLRITEDGIFNCVLNGPGNGHTAKEIFEALNAA
jgi:hypothetical protein